LLTSQKQGEIMSLYSKVHQPLINTDLLTSMENINREINNFFKKQELPQMIQGSLASNHFIPPVDITETDNDYTVEIDIPGMKAEDLTIEIIDNMLIVQGIKSVENRDNEAKGIIRTERSYGKFHRTLRFAHRINFEKVKAKIDNGVLKIKLEKVEGEAKNTRLITISK
jgi:HSP20 family protein